MTHVAGHMLVSTPAQPTGTVDAQPPAAAPETLHWDGQPQGWWTRHGVTVGVAAGAGALAGIGAAMLRLNAYTPGRPLVTAAIIGGAALGAATLAGGLTHWLRGREDLLPEPPPSGPAPTLPAAGDLPAVVPGTLRAGTHIGHGDGSYTIHHTHTRPDGHGGTETYSETHTEYFDWDIGVDDQVGRRDGYATMEEALRDLAAGDGAAIRRQGDRLVTYDLQGRSHWSDLDDLRVDDAATEAVVSPSGRIWSFAGHGPHWERIGETSRMDPTGIAGDSIGEHEVRYHGNPDVRVERIVSGLLGHATLPSALGELQARPGNQAVVTSHGRYHVVDVGSPELDRTVPLDGFVTSEHGSQVVVVEQQGAVWSPLGRWYVKPNQPT
jgi:hypothetical protein